MIYLKDSKIQVHGAGEVAKVFQDNALRADYSS